MSSQYIIPSKQLHSQHDLDAKWINSEAYKKLLTFVGLLNDSCVGATWNLSSDIPQSVRPVLSLLGAVDAWIAEYPPTEQGSRFGNKAYRDWWARLDSEAAALCTTLLPSDLSGASVELAEYLKDAFGNATRIDYGSGHETNFVAVLCALFVLGVYTPGDRLALALVVFPRYLDVVRRLQRTYNMEPAGSHGVWGLDDFQFLPYYWGSAQLMGQEEYEPADFVKPEVCARLKDKYLFFAAVDYIFQCKRGPFWEHSPILWDMSGLPVWEKANTGLLKMYKGEVLHKFPVIQHFKFGSIFPLRKDTH